MLSYLQEKAPMEEWQLNQHFSNSNYINLKINIAQAGVHSL